MRIVSNNLLFHSASLVMMLDFKQFETSLQLLCKGPPGFGFRETHYSARHRHGVTYRFWEELIGPKLCSPEAHASSKLCEFIIHNFIHAHALCCMS